VIQYNPKDAVMVWPAGDYPAAVQGCEETTSKAGNDMYVVTFLAYHGDKEMTLKDFVVMPDFVWKLTRLAQALGVVEQFEAGTFDPNKYVGRNVTLALDIEPAKGEFQERNKIKAYKPHLKATAVPPEDDEPLPF
jgi:hypothetical protein